MKVNGDVIYKYIAGGYFLIPTGELAAQYNGVFKITELGAEVWEMLMEENELSEIIQKLLLRYDVQEDILRHDIDEYIHILIEKELIHE